MAVASLKSRSTSLALAAAIRANDQRDVAAGEIMGFKGLRGDALLLADARLHRHDLAADDHGRIDLAEGHAQQVEDSDARPGRHRLNPEAEVSGEDHENDQRKEQSDDGADDGQHFPRVVG